jgi:hypothetical protein
VWNGHDADRALWQGLGFEVFEDAGGTRSPLKRGQLLTLNYGMTEVSGGSTRALKRILLIVELTSRTAHVTVSE